MDEPYDLRSPPHGGVLDKVPWGMRVLAVAAFTFVLALLPWARWLSAFHRM